VKLFEEEEDLAIYVVLDVLGLDGLRRPGAFDHARRLAAAMAYVASPTSTA
jgi:uncharacterized protein (DUF58 family)